MHEDTGPEGADVVDRDPPHLIPLRSGFGLWRWAALRGAGFPAELVLRLGAPTLAREADRLLEAEDARAAATERLVAALRGDFAHAGQEQITRIRRARRRAERGKLPALEDVRGIADAELDAMRRAVERAEAARGALAPLVDEARRAASRALADVARDPRFREAVTWQNRHGVRTALDSLARRSGDEPLRTRDRQHEDLVANYLHRYCAKNDTVGFFGPVGWARFDASDTRISVEPGPELLAHREVVFEQWAIDAIAEKLSSDARFRPWIAPRRLGFVRLEGSVAHSPVNGKHELTRSLELALRACDGATPARGVAARLTAEHPGELPDEASVYAALDALCEKQLVAWTFELGPAWRPDEKLRSRLERIEDQALRAEALAHLEALEDARRQVASAAGDPSRLAGALDALDETFTRITGQAATRRAGMMYAARGLVVEDCRRDLDVVVGQKLLADVGPALSLILTSARWLTFEVWRAYEAAFRHLYDDIVHKSGSARIPFSEFWFRAQRLIHGTRGRPLDAVAAQLRERWDGILGKPSDPRRVQYDSSALRPSVEAAFDAPAAGWPLARHHSPDLMICASSVEAIERGDYTAVLGEVHAAYNTLDQCFFVAQHPAPEELAEHALCDVPEPRVVYVPAKHSTMSAVRVSRAFFGPNAYALETGFEASSAAPDRILRLGELTLERRDDALIVSGPRGVSLDLFEVLGQMLTEVTMNLLALGSAPDHAPRVTIDRVVVRRESWRVLPSELEFAYAPSDLELFVGARRWARSLGLPRFVFVKSPHEVKPLYVDFDSVVSLRIIAKIIRHAAEHVSGEQPLAVTEMLPALDELWLPDRSGRLYTAELRVVASDRKPLERRTR